MISRWKMSGAWLGLVGVLAFGIAVATPGCTSTGDDDTGDDDTSVGDDDTATGDDDTTTGDDDTTTGDDDTTTGDDDTTTGDDDTTTGDDDTAGMTATPAPAMVQVTFTVDTTVAAEDGVNYNFVDTGLGEQVFIVGTMNGWNAQDPSYAMSATETAGVFSITLELMAGQTYDYKFAKTQDATMSDSDDQKPWSNVMKEYRPIADGTCEEAGKVTACEGVSECSIENPTGLMWEMENIVFVAPDTDTIVDTYSVEAWRNYAHSLGLPGCVEPV